MKRLSIGISPCPNDTFIFDALHSGLVQDNQFTFEFIFEDVETLNNLALSAKPDIVKLSYANYFRVMKDYCLLHSGGALGEGVGPLLISKKTINLDDIANLRVAIPGPYTTAAFLLKFAFPSITNTTPMVFSAIEEAVISEQVDAGVIIHENRFTYAEKGLHKLMDLGSYWETQTQLPVPLGGIAIRRDMPKSEQLRIENLIQESIRMSRANYPKLSNFVKMHAQEMEEDIMRKHIDLYVNDESISISERGQQAVQKMAAVMQVNSQLPIFI